MADRLTNPGPSRDQTSSARQEPFPGQPANASQKRKVHQKETFVEDAQETLDPAVSSGELEEALGFPNLAGNQEVAELARAIVQATMASVHGTNEYLRNKFLILYRLYRGESIAPAIPGILPLHSPEPYKAVETAHPRIMKALFGHEPWYRIEGEQPQDEEGAKHQEALCRQQHREMHWVSKASTMVRNLCIYGTAIQKTIWKQRHQEVTYRQAQRVPDPENPGASKTILRPITRREFTFDGNDARECSIFDFFTDPSVGSIDDAEWAADRSRWTQGQVLRMGADGHWTNLDQLEGATGDERTEFGDEYKERKSYSYGAVDPATKSSPHLNHFQVLDWWGLADFGDGEQIYNIVVIDPNGKAVVALVRKSPFWHGRLPYQVPRFLALSDELYGIGLIEPIARLSQEKDAKKSQFHAAAGLEGNPMLVIGASANVHDSQLVARPGLCLRAESADDIKPLFIPKASEALLTAMGELTTDIHDTTGITPAMMGQSSADTATEASANINESNMRIVGAVENFERELISPMLEQMCINSQQFLSRPKAIRVLGPEGLKYKDRYVVKPENIVGRFIFIPMASYRLSTALVQNQQLINILDRAPVLNQLEGEPIVKVSALLGKILREGFGFRDVAEFLKLPAAQAGLLAAPEEVELWYHGIVPPVRDDDNHMRHARDQAAALEAPSFAEFEKKNPGKASECRAHVAEHMKRLAQQLELQEQAVMLATQRQALLQPGGGDGGRGFAGPNQDQGSPTFRRDDEGGMPEDEEGAAKSEGSQGAPNPGGS